MTTKFKIIAEFIENSDNFLILTHQRPDGDAIGSSTGLLNHLLEMGKNATAYFPEELPKSYNIFTFKNTLYGTDIPDLQSFDTIIFLDTATSERIGGWNGFSLINLSQNLLNIDHHPDNEGFGTLHLLTEDSAASETVQELIRAFDKNNKLSMETSRRLMLGILADTGSFRYDNTSPKTLNNAAELLATGINYNELIRELYFSRPLNYIQFESDLVANHLKTAFDNKFLWFFIPPALVEKHNIDLKNAEGLIEQIRQIDGAEAVAIITKFSDEIFKISLRSKNPRVSVGRVARTIGGGGHEMAAGCKVKTTSLEEAEAILLKEIKLELEDSL